MAKKRIPMCWKCASKITEPNQDDTGFTLVGCKENDKIHDYDDAQKLCPVVKELDNSPDK